MTPYLIARSAKRAKFAALDYSKNNSELAELAGVSKTAIGWWRKKLGHASYPSGGTGRAIPPEQRFTRDVDKTSSPHGCWLWTGSKDRKGYGVIYQNGKKHIFAHRYSWVIHNSPIPDKLLVLHNCPGGDNPACVNPAHLYTGTHAQNMADKIRNGTSGAGEANNQSKITAAHVAEIRSRFAAGDSLVLMAKDFAIGYGQIWCIANRKSWKHVP